ncbi:MAG: phosphatidylcholine/phosphatidylserine synthase [Micavibrio sp.]|nr:phosphatidylcholine/phosphatidylserine synthase [Micavibrio sp.]
MNPIPRPKKLPLHKMIPNMITLTAIASGMTAIRFAISSKIEGGVRWEMAAIAIVVAAFMDAFDGAAARLLKAQSKLGAELDSFSDLICFGVAPAIVIYLWILQGAGKWGWPVALIYAMAVALRLAKFNIMTDEKDPDDPLSKYFSGVPSPMGGALALLPLVLSFALDGDSAFERTVINIVTTPQVIGVWMVVVAAMMVGNFPTFSTKQIRVPYKMKVPALALFSILIVSLINAPWPTLIVVCLFYIALLPVGIVHYNRKERSLAQGVKDPDDAEDE